ncbi:MAG: 1-deoxy-D-xylulose-5-phosphate reductoisomerase [Rhabdochlamydiaceae bacterium]|nr:1-deoxy-D-xylulose-5-phosphate reductoisomerase [Rhabdochlamydiaceae bacterium]
MSETPTQIALLGSTGSIGCNTLEVVRHLAGRFQVVALAARSQIDLLEQQAKEFKPQLIAVYEESAAQELQKRLPDLRIVAGMEGLLEAASLSCADTVVSAMTGTIGILPTVAAIRARKQIALANKEVLVSAGKYVMKLAQEMGVKVLPIDSEHSALFQCLNHEKLASVRRLMVTASGGPFLNRSIEDFASITPEMALNHPNWKMGPKVTVDSSNLMNKGLEVIEAHFLFDIPVEQIEVVIHPQSVVHSMVEYVDGSILAQMSEPHMLFPIQYALTYPERLPGILKPFDVKRFSKLEFFEPDTKRFPCLALAFEALHQGGTAPCFLNAANEVLVHRFLKGQIAWTEISRKLETLMLAHAVEQELDLNKILATDTLARESALHI